MDRDRFESALDQLIGAQARKIRAEIDAAACQTRFDFARMHQAQDAFEEARDAFLDQVFAPPLPAPPPTPVLVVHEEQVRGQRRGRPFVWQRWLEIRIPWRGVLYTFTANASFLTQVGGPAEITGPDFLPLGNGHTVRFRGIDYQSHEDGPPELIPLAVDACRGVALHLHAAGLGDVAPSRAWPAESPTFAEIVEAAATVKRAA